MVNLLCRGRDIGQVTAAFSGEAPAPSKVNPTMASCEDKRPLDRDV